MAAEQSETHESGGGPTLTPIASHLPWWLVFAAMVGLLIFLGKDEAVFPNASLDLKMPRAEIIQRTAAWSKKLGYDPNGSIKSTTFSWDANAKTFLEFELGAEAANQVMKGDVPIWYWRTRFCRESQPEEMRVCVTPDGRLLAFIWYLQNDLSVPSVSHAQAEKIAQQFCTESAALPLSDYVLVNDATETLAARTDHAFTWEQKSTDIRGAKQRISVRVSGNVVSRFNHYLKVPEAWENKFKMIRSYNALLSQIARVFYYLLNAAAVFFFFRAVATHNIKWKLVLTIGAVFAVGLVLENCNNAARIFESYSTNQTVQAYLTNYYIDVAINALRVLVLSACFLAAAETFYRVHYGDKIAVENYFRIKGLSTNQLKVGLWVGFCGCGIALGWVVLFYLVGERVGVWCPLGITNYEVLSSAFPFFSAICLGVQASISEEVLYRLFALSLARMVVKNFWLANLLQAAAWGFMHSTYPQQPAYARGIELTCSGLVFGWIMNRFGLLPCIAAHYLLDAFLDSQALLRSTVPALQLSAFLPIIPLLAAAVLSSILTRRKLVSDSQAINQSIPSPVHPEHSPAVDVPPFQYRPLSRMKLLVLVCVIAVAVPLGLYLRSAPAVGDGFHLQINREQALAKARQIMEKHGVSAENYMYCAWLDDQISTLEMQYVYEKAGLQRVLELAPLTQTGLMWRVRFFKPQQVDEYEVQMDGSGSEVSFDITKSDEDASPHVSELDAKKIVEQYISSVNPRVNDRQFVNVSEDLKPARLDYTFSFKVPNFKVGDADYKLSTALMGNEVSSFGQGWLLPDKWKWERNKKTERDEIARQVKTGSTVLIAIAVLWWAFGLLRTGTVRWRVSALLAIPVALLMLVIEINDLPMLYRSYMTIKPLSTFAAEQLLSSLTSVMSKFVEVAFGGAFALAVFRMLFPDISIVSILRTTVRPADEDKTAQRNIWLDAIAAAYALVVCDWLIDCLGYSLQAHLSPAVPLKYLTNVCSNANMYCGAVDYFINAFLKGLNDLLLLGVVVGVYAKYIGKRWLFFVIAALQSVIVNSDQRYWQDFAVLSVTGFLSSSLYWTFVIFFARRNILAYFLAGFVALLFRKLPSLVEHALPCYTWDVVSVVVLLLLPVGYLIWLLVTPKKTAKDGID